MVVSLVGATCQAASHTAGAPACDLLAIVCDGLRPQGCRLEHGAGPNGRSALLIARRSISP